MLALIPAQAEPWVVMSVNINQEVKTCLLLMK
jgi:hypothetical protein